MPIMTTKSLSQSSKRGAHLLAGFQCLNGQLVDLGPLFADLNTLIYLVRRNHNYTIQICHDEVSRIDREWLVLFWRGKFDRNVQCRCPRESVRAERRR